jgi:hypothetical protein
MSWSTPTRIGTAIVVLSSSVVVVTFPLRRRVTRPRRRERAERATLAV